MNRRASMSERGNKLWHGSRFVLPEHREALLAYDRQEKRQVRPVLDPDQLEELNRILTEALQEEQPIAITAYSPYGNERIRLVPQKIDPISGKLKGVQPDTQQVSVVLLANILDITAE